MEPTPQKPAMPTPAREASGRQMILTMGAIGFVCGLLIVLTYQLTFPVIQQNKAEALERAIFEVVPGAVTKTVFTLRDDELVAGDDEGAAQKYFACYDEQSRLVGVAVEAQGQGFQDVLRVIYGYSPEAMAIVGLKVLESKETPGLGDKIEKDPRFRANFDALKVELDATTEQVVNPITLVKYGEKTEPWQVESITGATISSRAIAMILEKSSAVTVPVITDNLATLEGGSE